MAGLAIQTLALTRFRSHSVTRLALDGRPVVLAGPNGAGKTNVIEAISLLSPGRGLRRADGPDLPQRPGNAWKIAARVAGLAADHDVETWAEGALSRQVRIDGKAGTQAGLGRILRVLWLVPAMDRLWIEAADGRRRFLDRMTLSFAPDHAEASLAYEKAMRDRNRLLKDGVTDPHWYAALEIAMADAATVIAANRRAALDRLARAQAGAQAGSETLFPAADLSLIHPEGEPDDLAAALADGRRRDMAAGRTLTGPHRADLAALWRAKGVPADQCSTGEQKALLLSLILANARALAADLGRAPVLLLDEVAAHLDADRRAALYDALCALGAQAFLTGTETALFDSLGSRAQVLQVVEDGGQSRVLA